MRITCDPSCNMGYISLQPNDRLKFELDMSTISKYVNAEKLNIPIVHDNLVERKLKKLTVTNKQYHQALEDGEFDEEYQNDCDEEGYLSVVELNMSKEEFINLINKQGFRLYKVNFRNDSFNLITFDIPNNVLDSNNVLYPLTKKADVFVITDIQTETSEYKGQLNTYRTVYIKGLLSCRNDKYPIEYLTKPEFILFE